MDNSITVCGNLTADPELRFTQTGTANANFGMAVNRKWQNKATNEWEEEVSFFRCVAWRDTAEHIAESLQKGARVVVTGRLQQRRWETDDGESRSVFEIVVDDIGPSLRWATVDVHRVERQGPRNDAPPPDDPFTGTAAPAAQPALGDEEPF